MKGVIGILVIGLAGAGLFFVIRARDLPVDPGIPTAVDASSTQNSQPQSFWEVFDLSGDTASTTAQTSSTAAVPGSGDTSVQLPLLNPPQVVKGIYITSWVAGVPSRVDSLIALIKRAGLNAVVVDIKDYSGYVSYNTGISEVQEAGAHGELRIANPGALLRKFHDNGIYVIGRISIFQDPILAKAHPEWALRDASGKLWHDRAGLAWLDVTAQPVWDYNVAIAKDALTRGFDEIQFDYIRFPSDGDLAAIRYPFWNETGSKHEAVARFFSYLSAQLPPEKISADLFGQTTFDRTDVGIGQLIEDGYRSFGVVSPMVYPSHYIAGFLGHENPAQHPYEVVQYSIEQAKLRLEALNAKSPGALFSAKLRPWLQVFDLGAEYDAGMVQEQVRAVEDVLGAYPEMYAGYLFWDPKVRYAQL